MVAKKIKYMEFDPPHPSIARQLQILSNILDTRPKSAIKLDKMARESHIDIEELDLLKQEIIRLPFKYPKSSIIIESFAKDNLETRLQMLLDRYYEDDANVVYLCPANCFPDRNSLIKYRIELAAIDFLDISSCVFEKNKDLQKKIFLTETPFKLGMSIVLEKRTNLLNRFKNSERDKVARWIEGSQVPALHDLFKIINEDVLGEDFVYCSEILFVATVLQKAEQMALPYSRLQNVFEKKIANPDYQLSSTTEEAFECYKELGGHFVHLQKQIKRQAEKGDYDFNKILESYEQFSLKYDKNNMNYEWQKFTLLAITKIYEGEFDAAIDIFKELIPNLFYNFHQSQTSFIIDEKKTCGLIDVALSLGAVLKKKAFLKMLKQYCVLFGIYARPIKPIKSSYDAIPNVNKESRTTSVDVVDWEMKSWADMFFQYFPKSLIKKADSLLNVETGVNQVIVIDPEKCPKEPQKPYKTPFQIGYKIFPQLAWFTLKGDAEAVKKLVENNVDVNELTSSRDSSLLLAIVKMNPNGTPYEPQLGLNLFEIISRYEHKIQVVNTPTDKRNLTCLGLSIRSGKLNVVRKIVEMGADVDALQSTLEETALFSLVKHYNRIDIDGFWDLHEMTPKNMDRLRREIDFFRGLPNDVIAKNYDRFLCEGVRLGVVPPKGYLASQFERYIDRAELVEIARLLLEKKANPNYPHEYEWNKGYTPLMLAAQCDNLNLFKLMLEYGGKPDQQAIFFNGTKVSCWEIAFYYNSKSILTYLEKSKGEI